MNDTGSDGLGGVSIALNRMAQSLQDSFGLLSDKEWMQTGIAGLNEKMLGEYDIGVLTHDLLEYIVEYVGGEAGVFYQLRNDDTLKFLNGTGITRNSVRDVVPLGDGIVGQCAVNGKTVYLKDVPENLVVVSHAIGAVRASHILVLPVFYERNGSGYRTGCPKRI